MTKSIQAVIADLYRIADVPQPTGKLGVILLGELIGGYNLTCNEIAGLTSEAASNFLLRHGAILEPNWGIICSTSCPGLPVELLWMSMNRSRSQRL